MYVCIYVYVYMYIYVIMKNEYTSLKCSIGRANNNEK